MLRCLGNSVQQMSIWCVYTCQSRNQNLRKRRGGPPSRGGLSELPHLQGESGYLLVHRAEKLWKTQVHDTV